MKRLIGAAAVLAVGVSIAVTSIGGAQTSGERTLKFVEKGGSSKFLDNPPKATKRHPAPSAGDSFLFSSQLYDESGARVGFVTGQCTIGPGAGRNNPNCAATAKLADGTVTVAGIGGNSRTTVLAITGGTGAYEGARGSVTSVSRSDADNAPSDDTIHLLG